MDLQTAVNELFQFYTHEEILSAIDKYLETLPKIKVVVNTCYGGFGLSDWANKQLGLDEYQEINRTDERLIKLIEDYGSEQVSGRYAILQIWEVPQGAKWRIEEYDGIETIEW